MEIYNFWYFECPKYWGETVLFPESWWILRQGSAPVRRTISSTTLWYCIEHSVLYCIKHSFIELYAVVLDWIDISEVLNTGFTNLFVPPLEVQYHDNIWSISYSHNSSVPSVAAPAKPRYRPIIMRLSHSPKASLHRARYVVGFPIPSSYYLMLS